MESRRFFLWLTWKFQKIGKQTHLCKQQHKIHMKTHEKRCPNFIYKLGKMSFLEVSLVGYVLFFCYLQVVYLLWFIFNIVQVDHLVIEIQLFWGKLIVSHELESDRWRVVLVFFTPKGLTRKNIIKQLQLTLGLLGVENHRFSGRLCPEFRLKFV